MHSKMAVLKKKKGLKLISKMLKLDGHFIEESDKKSFSVTTTNYHINIFYEKEETEEEKQLRLKQIESLKQSIERREKLLANENYVKKAPAFDGSFSII